MHRILDVLLKIQAIPSKADKIRCLKQNVSPTLVDVLGAAFNPAISVKFGTLRLKGSGVGCPDVEEFLRVLFDVQRRMVIGAEARAMVAKHCSLYPLPYQPLIVGIFTQQLDLGLKVRDINAAIPGCIPDFHAAELIPYEPGVLYPPFWVAPIPRGARVLAFASYNAASIVTPQGEEVVGCPHINALLRKLPAGVYDGYLIHQALPDKTSKYFKTVRKGHEHIVFSVLDYVVDWDNPTHSLIDRLKRLKVIHTGWASTAWNLLPHTKCMKTPEVLRAHSEHLGSGNRGTVVRINSPYIKGQSEGMMYFFD